MKFDPSKRKDIGTLRTIKALEKTLFELLTVNAFETLTIQKICTRSMIPRSTFYNYFEDKYDLLEVALNTLFAEKLAGTAGYSFDSVVSGVKTGFDFIDTHRLTIDRILAKNKESSYFYRSLQTHLFDNMKDSFIHCPSAENLTFEPELTARFCAAAIWSLIDLKLRTNTALTTREAENFLLASINYEALGMSYQR